VTPSFRTTTALSAAERGVHLLGEAWLNHFLAHAFHDAILPCHLFKLRDSHLSIFEDRADFEPAPIP
jgi:hypothetical protein